jgi:hypothetical protein
MRKLGLIIGTAVGITLAPRAARDEPYGPRLPSWRYASTSVYSPNTAGAQRLANGDTLICRGEQSPDRGRA